MKTFLDIIDEHGPELFRCYAIANFVPTYPDFINEFHGLLANQTRRIAWFREHDFSDPHYYLAQPITGFNGGKPEWHTKLGTVVKLADPTGDHVLPPSTLSPKLIVAIDFLLILSSLGVIWDMTNGPSVGATAEVCFANIMNRHVLMIRGANQRVSAFAEAMCQSVATPNQLIDQIIAGQTPLTVNRGDS
jgi:hypothetical protein